MLEFYSVENPIKVHNGKKWLEIKDKDLRHCLTIDPATTDDVYSIVVFSTYEDALQAALDGVIIAPEKTAPNKKVSLTSQEQFPIFKWQFEGQKSDIEDDSFELADKSTLPAKRITTDCLTVASASLAHVNPSRFKEVAFYIPEMSSEEDIEEDNPESNEVVAQQAQAELNVAKADEAKQPEQQPAIKAAAAKPGLLNRAGHGLLSFTKGVFTRPSLWLGGAAALATEYGPQIIKDTIPDVPYVGDVVMAATATVALVEAGRGIYQGAQHCRKPALKTLPESGAKRSEDIDALLAKHPEPITTQRNLARAQANVASTTPVVEKKKDSKVGVRV